MSILLCHCGREAIPHGATALRIASDRHGADWCARIGGAKPHAAASVSGATPALEAEAGRYVERERERRRAKARTQRERDGVLRDLGLVRVRGAVSGRVYWE